MKHPVSAFGFINRTGSALTTFSLETTCPRQPAHLLRGLQHIAVFKESHPGAEMACPLPPTTEAPLKIALLVRTDPIQNRRLLPELRERFFSQIPALPPKGHTRIDLPLGADAAGLSSRVTDPFFLL